MTTLNFKPLVACLLVAVGMGTHLAHAEGLRVDATATSSNLYELAVNAGDRVALFGQPGSLGVRDEWTALGRTGFSHVNVDVSGRDMSASTFEVAMGPQYPLNSKVTLGGEWENLRAAGMVGHAPIDAYHFAVRVSF